MPGHEHSGFLEVFSVHKEGSPRAAYRKFAEGRAISAPATAVLFHQGPAKAVDSGGHFLPAGRHASYRPDAPAQAAADLLSTPGRTDRN